MSTAHTPTSKGAKWKWRIISHRREQTEETRTVKSGTESDKRAGFKRTSGSLQWSWEHIPLVLPWSSLLMVLQYKSKFASRRHHFQEVFFTEFVWLKPVVRILAVASQEGHLHLGWQSRSLEHSRELVHPCKAHLSRCLNLNQSWEGQSMHPAGPGTQFMPRAARATQTNLFSAFFAASGEVRMHQLMHFHCSQHFHVASLPLDKASCLHKEMLCGDWHQHYSTLQSVNKILCREEIKQLKSDESFKFGSILKKKQFHCVHF